MATLSAWAWEPALCSVAKEAWHTAVPTAPNHLLNRSILDSAYAYCDSITAVHSRTFYIASRLLPAAKRRAVRALYAFCRASDDITNGSQRDSALILAAWRKRALATNPVRGDSVDIAWADTRRRYRIPIRYTEQFIDGVARDLRQRRFETFADLASYAYSVASTVSLMSARIIGVSGPEAIPYAVKMGIALQITRILRDVGEDLRSGRIYLPAEDLARFGVTEADLAAGRVDDRWRALMQFEIDRTRRLYAEAWPGVALLHEDGRLAVAAVTELYRAILDDIEANDYDVFTRRAHVGHWKKLAKIPGIWLRKRDSSTVTDYELGYATP